MSNDTHRYLLEVPCNGDVKFFTYLGHIKEKAVELQKVSEELQKGIESLENLNASINVAIEVPKEIIDHSNFEKLYKVY